MSFKTKKEAEKYAREHTPAGWRYEVWENLGWHVRWLSSGPITVYMGTDKVEFYALISRNCDGSGGPWTSKQSSKSVIEAARKEVKAFYDYVYEQRRIFAMVEEGIRDVMV